MHGQPHAVAGLLTQKIQDKQEQSTQNSSTYAKTLVTLLTIVTMDEAPTTYDLVGPVTDTTR